MMVWILGLISLTASLAYGLVLTHRPMSVLRTAVKAVPVLCLSIIALWLEAPALLIAGLALGTVGDIALSRRGDRAFLAGLGAFLLGHLCYLLMFWEIGDGDGTAWRFLAAAAVIGIGAAVFWHLYDAFGPLRLPVWAYVVVSVTLGVVAIWSPSGWAVLGVILFILSDVFLAFDLFGQVKAKRAIRTAVWFTYWAGQSLILFGMPV